MSWTATLAAGPFLNSRTCWQYSVGAGATTYDIYASGLSPGLFQSNATLYLPFNAGLTKTVEAQAQSVLPTNGAFAFLLAVALFDSGTGIGSDATITVAVRINGVTSPLSLTMVNSATPHMARNTSTVVTANAGDVVNFIASSSGPIDFNHRTTLYCAVGFSPS